MFKSRGDRGEVIGFVVALVVLVWFSSKRVLPCGLASLVSIRP